MATLFIPLNDGTHPCVSIGGVNQPTPPAGEIAAADVVYVLPCKYNVSGSLTDMVCAYVGQNSTTPTPYIFNVSTLAGFLTFLSTATVTNSLSTYTKLKVLNGSKNSATVLPSVLINQNLIIGREYQALNNICTIIAGSLSKTYPNTQLGVLGNQTDAGAAATASLAVPIAASPVNGDTLKAYINGVQIGTTYTVSGSPSQATVKTAIDAKFNSNTLGFTFVGTLNTNVDTLAGTAPTKGSFYNGYTVSFVRTGTTFGSSNVSATFSGGV